MSASCVFFSKSTRRLRWAQYFALYAVAVKGTSTCSPVTHFIEIVFDLSKAKLDMIFNLPKKRLTTIWTKATVAIGSMLSSENSGWMAPSSSLFLSQILLIRVWIRGARKMPVFNVGSYAQNVSCGMIYACDRVPCK